MRPTRRDLADEALSVSLDIRIKHGLTPSRAICIFDLCDKLGLTVRFVDINMEGMYVKGSKPEIWISSLRPYPRRVFTCAHELGHHLFGHGFAVDELVSSYTQRGQADPSEFQVDAFAGFLLMPTLGLRSALSSRGWKVESITPAQLYVIANSFNVGYETLISHMAYSLNMISREQATRFLRISQQQIRTQIAGQYIDSPLVVVDRYWSQPTIDVEVGTYVLFSKDIRIEHQGIEEIQTGSDRRLYRATMPGIGRAHNDDYSWATFVRISRFQYVGLSKYRHLEEVADE